MDIINATILTDDYDFGLALGEAVSMHQNRFVFTVCEKMESPGACDLLLLDLQDPDEREKAEKTMSGHMCVASLVGSRREVHKDIDSLRFLLYRYGGARALAADLLLLYGLYTGKNSCHLIKEGCQMVSITSTAGGAGKTSIAMGLAQELCRYHGKSVLYISMEEFESTLQYMPQREGALSLGEYLYKLFKPGGGATTQESFQVWDIHNVHTFMPSPGRNKLKDLDIVQLASFFEAVIAEGGYDYILVELTESFSRESQWILEQSEKIIAVLPLEEDERMRRYLAYLAFSRVTKDGNKLIKVLNHVRPSTELSSDAYEGAVLIDHDEESIQRIGSRYELSIDQDFGTGVKELSKKLRT